jgi:hypothetical protein
MYSGLSKKILLLLTLLTISGCSTMGGFSLFGKKEAPAPIPVEIRTVEVQIPITHPAMPRGIKLRDPQWYVVSDKNVDTFMEDIQKRHEGQLVFMAMSVGDYELMAYNMQEIRRYITQLKEVVIYYRTINTNDEEEPVKDESDEK